MSYEESWNEQLNQYLLQLSESGALNEALVNAYGNELLTETEINEIINLTSDQNRSIIPDIKEAVGTDYFTAISIYSNLFESDSGILYITSRRPFEKPSEEIFELYIQDVALVAFSNKISSYLNLAFEDSKVHYDFARSALELSGKDSSLNALNTIDSNLITNALNSNTSPILTPDWSETGVATAPSGTALNSNLLTVGETVVVIDGAGVGHYVYTEDGKVISSFEADWRPPSSPNFLKGELSDESTFITTSPLIFGGKPYLELSTYDFKGDQVSSTSFEFSDVTSFGGITSLSASNTDHILLSGFYMPGMGKILFDDFEVTSYANTDGLSSSGFPDIFNAYLVSLDKETLEVNFAINIGGLENDYPWSSDIYDDGSSAIFITSKLGLPVWQLTKSEDYSYKGVYNENQISFFTGNNILYFNSEGELSKQIQFKTNAIGTVQGGYGQYSFGLGMNDVQIEALSDQSLMVALSLNGRQEGADFTIYSQTKDKGVTGIGRDFNNEVSNLALLKFDDAGSFLWSAQTTESGEDEVLGRVFVSDLKTLSDGSSIVVGSFFGSHNFGDTTLTSTYNPHYDNRDVGPFWGTRDAFITLIDSNGNFKWATSFGGASEEYIQSFDISQDEKSIFILGSTRPNGVIGPGPFELGGRLVASGQGASLSSYIIKYDIDGDLISSDTNKAPTSVQLLDAITLIKENSDTSEPIIIANINITDDGLGENVLKLIGEDKDLFQINDRNNQLELKSGTTLDYESGKTSYEIGVKVFDPSLPDAPVTASLSIEIEDVYDPITGELIKSKPKVNTKTQGVTPFTIFGTNDFGVNEINLETLEVGFGTFSELAEFNEIEVDKLTNWAGIANRGNSDQLQYEFVDINDDGIDDLLIKVSTPDLFEGIGDLATISSSAISRFELDNGTQYLVSQTDSSNTQFL